MSDTWAPREGAYGRTRNGRKYGPLTRDGVNNWPWIVVGKAAPCWKEDGVVGIVAGSPGDFVSEWADDDALLSPVRTITRKEIVPGTYGIVGVSISASVGPVICIPIDTYSASQIRDAISTLSDIAGALEDNAK